MSENGVKSQSQAQAQSQAKAVKPEVRAFVSRSGIPLKNHYTQADLAEGSLKDRIGEPGSPPFVRGVQPDLYRGRLWTMRQYAGFGTAEESNRRYHYLLAQGTMGLSVAFDLPTQLGLDPDHPRSKGEVGKVGVSVSTLDEMRVLFRGIDLSRVSTSMTINATAPILLAFYVVVAEEQGVKPQALRGTVQNDVLKEYVARGNYIYPPRGAMRLTTDMFAWCAEHTPKWNPISISGYHIREAGSTAVQELAFTFADAIAYVQAALDRGLKVDDFAPQLSFFFNVHSDFFEEIAKFRAARRIWAKIMTERFGAKDPKSKMVRFHSQTAGSTLTAQQPHTNVVRVTLQALASVLGGTQSLHTNSLDEALALPTEASARLALRTQQVIAYESNVPHVVDPLGGSYFVESLTDELERRTWEYLHEIEKRGGTIACIESGYIQNEIATSAYSDQKAIDEGRIKVVGVNCFQDEANQVAPKTEILRVPPELEKASVERVRAFRAKRSEAATQAALRAVENAAKAGAAASASPSSQGEVNLQAVVLDAVRAQATLGEISDALRRVYGEFQSQVGY
jgi:methylmalonyl-CoA mutase N-terminal domain/subunit